MSAWHDPDRTLVNIFLEKSQFRSGSRPTYRWFLRSFEDAARCHPAVDRQMLTAWLRDMEKRWRLRTLLNQVCIVDRFLDHLVEIGRIANNPIALLRSQYNVKQNKPIWRALASPNPDEALAALRRPVPFGSVLGDFMRDHVMLMRSRGYQYEAQAHWLLRFDRFLQVHPELAKKPLEAMLTSWAAAKPTGTVRISVCGRAVDHQAAMALMKRSPKITANCAFAMVHSRGGIFHSFSDRFKIR
ncbi:Integrase/recombinase [Novosphingobium resinovorum]|uniref:Integrase/recombinase n=1 Tax=Novosphingobium resinovorum TaxID=158500 RepID=A0A031JKT2_9SPHN|nr:Integrase/recombinase [Novosphingobium resinovorum]